MSQRSAGRFFRAAKQRTPEPEVRGTREELRRFDVVHSIPSPYRLHLFRVLADRLRDRRYALHVHFLAQGHRDRSFWCGPQNVSFSHSYWWDVGRRVRGKEWHLNPGLVVSMAARPPTVLMVGGPWDTITGIALSLVVWRTHRIAWIEANTRKPGRVTGAALWLKRTLLGRYTKIAVPGREGAAYVNLVMAGEGARRIVDLPNVVDERMFRDPTAPGASDTVRSKLGLCSETPLAVWPARLIPDKGIVPVLSILGPEILGEWRILILGEGPLEGEIEAVIRRRGLKGHVMVRPPVRYEEMRDIYHAGDLFLLPSVSDKNPLSVVEALHSGLPVVVSDRIGNFPEAVRPGENGWGLDPCNAEDVLGTLRQALGTPRERLREMGRVSRVVARETWTSERAVDCFLDAALAD